jgi:hypothetical protein
MKEIITTTLQEVMNKVLASTPETKKQTKYLDILDVEPIKLIEFMRDNNIPSDAYFSGVDNGYDGWSHIVIEWLIDVPTTDKDKLQYQKNTFNSSSAVRKALMANGYKRKSLYSNEFNEFANTTVYDMYVSGDFDALVKYYSISWVKD